MVDPPPGTPDLVYDMQKLHDLAATVSGMSAKIVHPAQLADTDAFVPTGLVESVELRKGLTIGTGGLATWLQGLAGTLSFNGAFVAASADRVKDLDTQHGDDLAQIHRAIDDIANNVPKVPHGPAPAA